MDDHLAKPFSMQTLQDMLNRWMPRRQAAQGPVAEPVRERGKGDGVIDRVVLDQLGKVLTNGKPELLARVIKVYLAESPKLLQKLKQAAGAGEAADVVRAAHSLKSSSGNVGAQQLSRYCEDIEAAGRANNLEDVRRLLAKLEAEHGRVQEALGAEFESLAAVKA